MGDNQTAPTNTSADPSTELGITINSDGSVTRIAIFPSTPVTSDPSHPSPVLTKDIPLNDSKSTCFHIFLPRQAPNNSFPKTRLPLIVYYHGGGFVIGSAASTPFHIFCESLAVEIPAVVASVEYRLAPEHKLRAAYEDSEEALHCIKATKDEWLLNFADFSNTFLMGGSAGGNIVYHVRLRVASYDLGPLKIRGLILHQPFFSGVKRTESELRLQNNPVVPLRLCDKMWEMTLPVGVDRDHEFCNPIIGGGLTELDRVRMMGWKIMVVGGYGDPFIDRQIELVKMLEKNSVDVVSMFVEECHGFEVLDPIKGKAFCVDVKKFVLSLVKATLVMM